MQLVIDPARIDPPTRRAECRCGQLSATVSGDPVRISVCHCLDCQRRSGSAFAAQARFAAADVKLEGRSNEWVQTADSGNKVYFHWCPDCGCDVWYQGGGGLPEAIAIPVGLFTDPNFPAPWFSVWEERKHDWVEILGDAVEHFD